jgi:hypothetical protein
MEQAIKATNESRPGSTRARRIGNDLATLGSTIDAPQHR